MASTPEAQTKPDTALQPASLESQQTAPDTGKCHFFKLPPELRCVVYDMVLSDVNFTQDQGLEPRLARPAILGTCRLIQEEVAPMYDFRLATTLADVLSGAADSFKEEEEFVRAIIAKSRPSRHILKRMVHHNDKLFDYVMACIGSNNEEVRSARKTVGLPWASSMRMVAMIQAAANNLREAYDSLHEQLEKAWEIG